MRAAGVILAGDIGVVGRAPGSYLLYLGGDFEGTRVSFPVADKVPLNQVTERLEPAFIVWGQQRAPVEGLGDFCHRLGQAALQSLLRAPVSA